MCLSPHNLYSLKETLHFFVGHLEHGTLVMHECVNFYLDISPCMGEHATWSLNTSHKYHKCRNKKDAKGAYTHHTKFWEWSLNQCAKHLHTNSMYVLYTKGHLVYIQDNVFLFYILYMHHTCLWISNVQSKCIYSFTPSDGKEQKNNNANIGRGVSPLHR